MRLFLEKFLARIYKKLFEAHKDEKYSKYRKKYELTSDFIFNGKDIELYGEGRIIIGTNTVITKDIPSNCVVGGVPAKILKTISQKKSVFLSL